MGGLESVLFDLLVSYFMFCFFNYFCISDKIVGF